MIYNLEFSLVCKVSKLESLKLNVRFGYILVNQGLQ